MEHRIACHREAPGRHFAGGTRETGKDHLDSLRHEGGRKGMIGQLARHQGGRNGSIGQRARHQGGTKKARKNHLDGLGDTREAPGRQERINRTACRGTREAPGRNEGGRKNHLDSRRGTRETGKDQLDGAC